MLFTLHLACFIVFKLHFIVKIHTYAQFCTIGRKKGYGGALLGAGTLAAVGLAALAAISGKAMMTSMLALMMAGVSALRSTNGNGNSGGGGGGCKSAHFIDAHARAIEPARLEAVEPVEVYSQSRPAYSTPLAISQK